MRVGIYARVSTQDQQTLPLQLEVMRKYAKTRKWPVILEIKDIGSGVKERERRELLMQAARRREIDAVMLRTGPTPAFMRLCSFIVQLLRLLKSAKIADRQAI